MMAAVSEPQRLEIAFVTPLRVEHEAAPLGQQFLAVTYGGFTAISQGGRSMYTLPVTHEVSMQVSYVDAAGNPAEIDGEVAWSSSDESLCEVVADETDSSVCRVTPLGMTGTVQITATCDADLGSGRRELVTLADISLVAGEAVAGTIQPVGESTPQSD